MTAHKPKPSSAPRIVPRDPKLSHGREEVKEPRMPRNLWKRPLRLPPMRPLHEIEDEEDAESEETE